MMTTRNLFSGTVLMLFVVLMAACSSDEQTGTLSDEMDMETTEGMSSDMGEMTTTQTVKLNLNTTPEEDFVTLPGVGEHMAHEFQEYRPYVSIAEFRQRMSRYVEDEQITAFEELVFVPIDENESDIATLLQIPGLEESEAEAIVAERPFESDEAFIQVLSEYVSESELAIGESYLSAE